MNNRKISLINPHMIRPSQLFDSFFEEMLSPSTEQTASGLKTLLTANIEVDMYETETHIIIEAKVPGYKAENLNVKVEDNILIIEGTVQEESEEKQSRKYHIKEVKSQSIYRSIMLPSKVDSDNAEAEFTNGMVKIALPKLLDSKPKTIKIKTK